MHPLLVWFCVWCRQCRVPPPLFILHKEIVQSTVKYNCLDWIHGKCLRFQRMPVSSLITAATVWGVELFWAKIKCPVYTADGQDLNGNSLLCVFMADNCSAWLILTPSYCIICSWLWCQRVNTWWSSVAWVVWYGALQQLCRHLKGAQSSVQKNSQYFSYHHIIFTSSFEQKWRGAYLSYSQDICECWLGWIMFW